MMIAIPPTEWRTLTQLNLEDTAHLLKQLASLVELSKFRSHPRGQKRKIPKPKYDKKKPHVSTARLLAKAKAEKKAP